MFHRRSSAERQNRIHPDSEIVRLRKDEKDENVDDNDCMEVGQMRQG